MSFKGVSLCCVVVVEMVEFSIVFIGCVLGLDFVLCCGEVLIYWCVIVNNGLILW